MTPTSRYRASMIFVHVCLVTVLFFGQAFPVLATTSVSPASVDVLTIAGLILLLSETRGLIEGTIDEVSGEIETVLEELDETLSGLIEALSQTYQDNLNITVSSLDALTSNKLLEIDRLARQANKYLQEDIALLETKYREALYETSEQIQLITVELEHRLKNVIIVGGETAAYVLDKATCNTILVAALVFLGIGLLLFVWLLFSKRLPGGLARILVLTFMATYIALFGMLGLIPPVRTYAMAFTGIGLEQRLEKFNQPEIVYLVPHTITLGETEELRVIGIMLRPQDKIPEATIADEPVPVKAASDQEVVIDVADLIAPEGSTELVLKYDEDIKAVKVTQLIAPEPELGPPDLRIAFFKIKPTSPVVGDNATALIVVENKGGTPAENFEVLWRTGNPGPVENSKDLSRTIERLEPRQTQTIAINHFYSRAGTFDTVAEVDPTGTLTEKDETNNSQVKRITVRPAPPRKAEVVVTFDKIKVHQRGDCTWLDEGELWLDFKINGEKGRWPKEGMQSVWDNETYTINKKFKVTLEETDKLTIRVDGTESDSHLPESVTADDDMGSVSKTYDYQPNSAEPEWGEGYYSEDSTLIDDCCPTMTCPYSYYTIYYKIEVTWQ